MPRVPKLRAGLLDLAAGIGMAGPALMLLYTLDSRPPWMLAAVALLLAAATVAWVLWRRSGQRSRAAAISFAVIATATMALGNGSLYYGIIWTACLVLGVAFSAGAVLWLYAAALVLFVIALHVSSGSPVELVVTEALAAAFFAGVAAAVAVVLHDSLRFGDTLQATLTQLDAANAELRTRLDVDRDLVLARERERTARELHDGLGHRLSAIGLSLDYVTRVDDPDAAREEAARARVLVGDSLDAMRRLVRAMHPVELGALRDAEAFHAVADAFRGTGIDIAVTVRGDDTPLPHDHSLLLLRFVQEGLTNVVRHTNATAADLTVTTEAGGVEAVLEDSGGHPPDTSPVTEGFGLRSLRARAQSLGGRLDAGPTSRGFRLEIALPAAAEGAATATVARGAA